MTLLVVIVWNSSSNPYLIIAVFKLVLLQIYSNNFQSFHRKIRYYSSHGIFQIYLLYNMSVSRRGLLRCCIKSIEVGTLRTTGLVGDFGRGSVLKAVAAFQQLLIIWIYVRRTTVGRMLFVLLCKYCTVTVLTVWHCSQQGLPSPISMHYSGLLHYQATG